MVSEPKAPSLHVTCGPHSAPGTCKAQETMGRLDSGVLLDSGCPHPNLEVHSLPVAVIALVKGHTVMVQREQRGGREQL
jgi:hypothetical protein